MPSKRNASLLTIFLVVFIDLLGFGIVIPILPYYAHEYGASGWTLGWLMTCYSLMQFLFSPVWGGLSDRIGRRPVLLLTIAGTCASMVLLGLAPNLTLLFIARILAGLFGANISTAYAYIADITTEENRAKGMGVIGAGFGLGFVFGPALGGLLSRWGYQMPMFAGAGLAAINLIFAFSVIKEPVLTAQQRAAHRVKRFDPQVILAALGNQRTRFAITLFLLLTLAVTQMEVTFALFIGERYGYNAMQAGILLATMGLIMAGVQGGMIGKLTKHFGEQRLVPFGAGICVIALIVFGMTHSIYLVILSLIVLATGHGIMHPTLSSLASRGASSVNRGATMGVFQSAGSLARIIGPPTAGWLFDQVGRSAPFYAGAVIMAIGLVLALTPGKTAYVSRRLREPSIPS